MTQQTARLPKKRRRTRTWIVLAAVWLAVSYVSSYGIVAWLSGRYASTATTTIVRETVFYPLRKYERTDLPGSVYLATFEDWMLYRGRGESFTWAEVERGIRFRRRDERAWEKLKAELRKRESESRISPPRASSTSE
jgi:hypothetical protein